MAKDRHQEKSSQFEKDQIVLTIRLLYRLAKASTIVTIEQNLKH
nr:hypothetical protein [Moraxella osloensis]